MYTQAIDIPQGPKDEAPRGPRSLKDAEYEAEFDARVGRGEFVEPN